MNEQNITKDQYIGVFVALVVVGGMFFGLSFLYKSFGMKSEPETNKEINNPTVSNLENIETLPEDVKMVKEEDKPIINRIQTIKNMEIKTTVEGTGVEAKVGDTVNVHYTGKLTDGTVFDSSIPRGQTFEFRLGEGRVIAGWEEGVKGMKVGEKRTLTIPGNMAYGSSGVPNRGKEGYLIPPNATLVFDVELVSIK